MKKLILIIFMISAFFVMKNAEAQDVVRWGEFQIIDALDLSGVTGADTTIYITAATAGKSPVWNTNITWTSITGAGTVAIVVSMDGTNWYAYNSSPSSAVSGASGNYQFEDDYLSWPYWGLKITISTISVGTMNATVYFKKR